MESVRDISTFLPIWRRNIGKQCITAFFKWKTVHRSVVREFNNPEKKKTSGWKRKHNSLFVFNWQFMLLTGFHGVLPPLSFSQQSHKVSTELREIYSMQTIISTVFETSQAIH